MMSNRNVAVGLLTAENLQTFGASLKKVYPVDETPCFGELLRAMMRPIGRFGGSGIVSNMRAESTEGPRLPSSLYFDGRGQGVEERLLS